MSFRGLAVGKNFDVFAIGNDGVLIHNNGVDIWEPVSIGTTLPLRCIQFISSEVGYIGSDDALIFKTTDGGATWTDINANITQVGTVSEIHFLNENKGFICGFNYMQVTEDGGLNFEYVPGFTPAEGLFQFVDMQFVNDQLGFAVGDQGIVYKTENGGETWELKDSGIETSIRKVQFLSEDVGYICAFDGFVSETTDGGETWTPMTSDNTEHFRSMAFTGNKGFIGTHFGDILEYQLPSSTESITFKSLQIAPNPTDGLLQLEHEETFLSLKIYSSNGTLVNNTYDPNSTVLDLSSLPQGMYFIKAHSAKEQFLQSFIKQ